MKWRDFLRGAANIGEGWFSLVNAWVGLPPRHELPSRRWSYEEEFGTDEELLASDWKVVTQLEDMLPKQKTMKWVAIAGGWRKTNEKVELDVRKTVREIFERGDGIVSGGALGVDYLATDEALQCDPVAGRIRIFLPATIERYAAHYRMRAGEGVITYEQAESLIAQLQTLKRANPHAIAEHSDNMIIDKAAYFGRITKIVEAADELVAFHINNTEGTQDTITKAKKRGIPVVIFSYTIA